MQNPVAFEVHYNDYKRQMAWVNDEVWKIEKREKRYRMRAAVAKALIGLANVLTPVKQETRTA